MGLRCLLLAAVSSLAISSSALADQPKREMHFERGIIRVQTGEDIEKKVKEEITNPLGLKSRYRYNQEDLKKYQSWINQCIDHSKNGNFCLVVDKAAHEMDVYQDGEKIITYLIELGKNPYDDKRMLGDNCTPEGTYKIRHVLKNSSFYKALYIDYPNIEDAERGLKDGLINQNQYKRIVKAIKEGKVLLWNTRLGGQIEIHGSGAEKEEPSDWTVGCVALSNPNIDSLYEILGLTNHKTMSEKELNRIARKIRTCIVKYGARDNY